MKLPTLTFFFALLSLVGGFAIGLLFKKQRADSLPQQSIQTTKSNTRSAARPQSHSSHFLRESTIELRAASSFPAEVLRIQREHQSPLRTSSTLDYYVYETSYDELSKMLARAAILDLDLLDEVGHRLAREDPDRILFQLMVEGKVRTHNETQHIAFYNAVLKETASHAPERGHYWLTQMKRGAPQRAYALRFSSHLTNIHPEIAAERFEELVYLQGIGKDQTVEYARTRYAKKVMENWVKKDREAAEDYLANLSEGQTRTTLRKALESVSK